MKQFVYKGKFNGDESTLPQREHPKGAVPFREPEMKRFTFIANIGSAIAIIALMTLAFFRGHAYLSESVSPLIIACALSMLTMVPHEFLHAICFRDTAYMYSYPSKFMMFVFGTEDLSKTRFIIMSLCPNIVFGFIPFMVGMLHPQWITAAIFGALCIGMGFGDYINVFHAVTQVPRGAKTYLSGFHSYWYLP